MKPSPSTQPAASREAGKQVPASARKQARITRKKFNIPRGELAMLAALKTRARTLRDSTKKSDLIRAGLMALDGLTDRQLEKALAKVAGDARSDSAHTH